MAFDFSANQNKNYLDAINQNAPDASAALKVLSLNLPGFVGGSPILPDALLKPGLSTAAQVGGTQPVTTQPVSGPVSAPAPAAPALTAPLPPPPSAGGVSPFTSAPIANIASQALSGQPSPDTTSFAPDPTPPAPNFQYTMPRPDISGGQAQPAAPNPLAQLLDGLIGRGPHQQI